jgi:hypothetical protein
MHEIRYFEKQFKSLNFIFCSARTRFFEPVIPGERNFNLELSVNLTGISNDKLTQFITSQPIGRCVYINCIICERFNKTIYPCHGIYGGLEPSVMVDHFEVLAVTTTR